MKIQDFCNMTEFESIMSNWATATGLATVAVGEDGEYISECYNFTDFCIKYTRGTTRGRLKCEKCDREGKGVYHCHAGLIDFAIDLTVNGVKLGQVIGGQVLPKDPDEMKFREVAKDIGVMPDEYIEALHRVNVRSEEIIEASAKLLGETLNNFVNAEYSKYENTIRIERLTDGIEKTNELVQKIIKSTRELQNIQKRQKIVAINASIEAARVGQAGRGFAVVAEEVERLSESSSVANKDIEDIIEQISRIVRGLNSTSLQDEE